MISEYELFLFDTICTNDIQYFGLLFFKESCESEKNVQTFRNDILITR